jgi:hypothetical protein
MMNSPILKAEPGAAWRECPNCGGVGSISGLVILSPNVIRVTWKPSSNGLSVTCKSSSSTIK